jgi:hypothetical protein
MKVRYCRQSFKRGLLKSEPLAGTAASMALTDAEGFGVPEVRAQLRFPEMADRRRRKEKDRV